MWILIAFAQNSTTATDCMAFGFILLYLWLIWNVLSDSRSSNAITFLLENLSEIIE